MKNYKTLALIVLAGMFAAAQSDAQEEAGKKEFENSCAVCHGVKAVGDGPLAELLTVEVSDLTRLQINNGGTFPLDDVKKFIDGRSSVRAHGLDMPVWGDRYVAEASNTVTRYQAEEVADRRILALALYLQSIQKK